jgi:hypothetical protein
MVKRIQRQCILFRIGFTNGCVCVINDPTWGRIKAIVNRRIVGSMARAGN